MTLLKLRHPGFAVLLIVTLVVSTGCAPTPASLDEDDQPEVQTRSDSPMPDFLEKAGQGSLSNLSEEDIPKILEEYEPEERTELILRFLTIGLLFFYGVYERYPTPEEGLEILKDLPPSPDGRTYGPLARDILLLDGWGNKIQYSPATFGDNLPGFKLRSFGPDGVESDDDVLPHDMEQVAIEVTATIAAGGLDQVPAQGQ